MIIKAITIEMTGQEIAVFKKRINAEGALREKYDLDNGLHLVNIEQKIKGSDSYDAYVYKFERQVVL